ncbi:MAG: 6-phosphogluconolactonase [Terriglobales bacterium]
MTEWVHRETLPELTGEFSRRLRQEAAQGGEVLSLALTGGSSAAIFYDGLAQAGVPGSLQFYWSDERMVPRDDPDSNFKLADDHLLRPAGIDAARLHPAPTLLDPSACAAAYAQEIRQRVGRTGEKVPQFGIVILGLGADGHTGSLFPGRDPYADDDLLVRSVHGTQMHTHARVTFTPTLINRARQVWFVITGANKAWAVEQLAERKATVQHVPALVVDPEKTQVVIFADASATGGRIYD